MLANLHGAAVGAGHRPPLAKLGEALFQDEAGRLVGMD
jgi:hypothetical protein